MRTRNQKLGIAGPILRKPTTKTAPTPEPKRPRGRPKKKAAPDPKSSVKLTDEQHVLAQNCINHLTKKHGRPPTHEELLTWAGKLRFGAEAIETYLRAGLLQQPTEEVPLMEDEHDGIGLEPTDDGPVPAKKGRPSKASKKGGYRYIDESKMICEKCETLGHSSERCLERA